MPPTIPPKKPTMPNPKVDCPTCRGSGTVFGKGGKPVTCPTCKGSGKK